MILLPVGGNILLPVEGNILLQIASNILLPVEGDIFVPAGDGEGTLTLPVIRTDNISLVIKVASSNRAAEGFYLCYVSKSPHARWETRLGYIIVSSVSLSLLKDTEIITKK